MKRLSCFCLIGLLAILLASCNWFAKPDPEPDPVPGDVGTEIDFEISPTDLGNWDKELKLDAALFEEMAAGDKIKITFNKNDLDLAPQISFADGNWTPLGGEKSLEGGEYWEEYHCYVLSNWTLILTLSEEELEFVKANGMIIKGEGIVVKKVAAICNKLTDKNSTANAKRLYKYLLEVYGEKVITGQMENAWDNSFNQLKQVYDSTGKYPALMGYDFMQYTGQSWNPGDSLKQTQRAINFWNGKDYNGNKISDKHGIVAFCWHWFDPMHKDFSYDPNKTSFRIPYDSKKDEWKTSSAEYKAMLADMDVIANELLKLQAAGVPVIWRPLHEAAGNVGRYNNKGTAWFWWGAGSTGGELIGSETVMENGKEKVVNTYSVSTDEDECAESFIALWKLMYEYFTETKELHNLIWMWNGQNEKFYPGSEYVDIIGDDIYDLHQGLDLQSNLTTESGVDWFKKFAKIDKTKPVALSECGQIPYMENLVKDGAMWSFFMVWNDGSKSESDGNFWNGQKINPDERKMKVYTSDIAITLDELPDLTQY